VAGDVGEGGGEVVGGGEGGLHEDEGLDVDVGGEFFEGPDGDAGAAGVGGEEDGLVGVGAVLGGELGGDELGLLLVAVVGGEGVEAGVVGGPVVDFEGGEVGEGEAGGEGAVDGEGAADAGEVEDVGGGRGLRSGD
jgi:hypothetical protein